MKINLKEFMHHANQTDGLSFVKYRALDKWDEYATGPPTREEDYLSGRIHFTLDGYPYYNASDGNWNRRDLEVWCDDLGIDYHFEMFRYYSDGKLYLEPGNYNQDSFLFYSPIELKEFLNFSKDITNNLSAKIKFKEFNLKDVIDKIYITVNDNGKLKLCDIDTVKKHFTSKEFDDLVDIMFGDGDFYDRFPNFSSFCKDKNLPLSDSYYEETSFLLNGTSFMNVSTPPLDFHWIYLAIKVSPNFSSQYLFDLISFSKEADYLLRYLIQTVSGKIPNERFSIQAPKDFNSQVKYSIEFRKNYEDYLKSVNNPVNFVVTEMVDLKSKIINQHEDFKYIANPDNSDTVNSLKSPLPFILDKTFRSYSRATSDFDRQTYAGRLFNYILRSIVLYPLQELVYLKCHESNSDIKKILNELESDIPISDGTWATWFNEIAKTVGRDNTITLNYFGELIEHFQMLYNEIKKTIPKRNDWAHYREHSAEYQKHIDELLPTLLDTIRKTLRNINFIYIEKQEYKSDNELYISAKKVMGFEIDIETIEFSTKLSGSFFTSNKLYAYNTDYDYTLPLSPLIEIKFENIETIKMGMFNNKINGVIEYTY